MGKIPVIAVAGPTASGKTKLAVWLAKRFHGEVVSADSMQVYREMSIGTAKPTPEEMDGVPHHLYDFLDPETPFSVAEYIPLAKAAIEDIYNRGKIPIIAGGTGLYLSSLLGAMPFDAPSGDPALRERLQRYADENGNEALHRKLAECDPKLAEQLHPNNVGRVIRAIEVFEKTGVPMSKWQEEAREKAKTNSPYDACILGLACRDRQKLYDRINLRVDMMMEEGLLEEVKAFYAREHKATAAQAIGYKELFACLKGEMDLADAVEDLKRQTRRYAKRQLTWFRRDEAVQWLYLDDYADFDGEARQAEAIVEKTLGGKYPERLAIPGPMMVE